MVTHARRPPAGASGAGPAEPVPQDRGRVRTVRQQRGRRPDRVSCSRAEERRDSGSPRGAAPCSPTWPLPEFNPGVGSRTGFAFFGDPGGPGAVRRRHRSSRRQPSQSHCCTTSPPRAGLFPTAGTPTRSMLCRRGRPGRHLRPHLPDRPRPGLAHRDVRPAPRRCAAAGATVITKQPDRPRGPPLQDHRVMPRTVHTGMAPSWSSSMCCIPIFSATRREATLAGWLIATSWDARSASRAKSRQAPAASLA